METAQTPAADHATKFFVDNEEFTTSEKGLTVRQILTLSGNTPAENYRLIEYRGDSKQEVRHDDLDEVINVHENEKFAAAFKGETPVS